MNSVLGYETRFGTGWIVIDNEEISEILLPGQDRPEGPEAKQPPATARTLAGRLEEYFGGNPGAWEPSAAFVDKGPTEFLRSVYDVVSSIPPGATMSYGEVAAAAGSPGAARAVGQAMARNRYAPIIPCHRVVPSTGGVGNYGGGRDLKKAMLEMEAGTG